MSEQMSNGDALHWFYTRMEMTPPNIGYVKSREAYAAAIAALRNDQSCQRCSEWKGAWENMRYTIKQIWQLGCTADPKELLKEIDTLDPRRKSEPTSDPNDLWRRVTRGWR